MDWIFQFLLPVLYAFIASSAFGILFQIRGIEVLFTGIGGGVGWAIYLLVKFLFPQHTDVLAYAIASISMAVFSELLAIWRRHPALSYVTIAIFPLVPGAAILHTMEYLLRGDIENFANYGIYSLETSGAIAIGVLMGSSGFRIIRRAIRLSAEKKKGESS